MNEESPMNYAMALKHYHQNGRDRSMKKFCEDEGYDYEKFLRYSRKGQKEYSVLKESDVEHREQSGFIPLEVSGEPVGAIVSRKCEFAFLLVQLLETVETVAVVTHNLAGPRHIAQLLR